MRKIFMTTTKDEFLTGLAQRLKISDMYGLAKTWEVMSKKDDAIEKLIRSNEFTIEEKVYLGVSIGIDMSSYFS